MLQSQPWCPFGYTQIKSSCYKISVAKLTWQEAKTFCERETSEFIAVNNENEDSSLSSIMRFSEITEVWIGLNDLAYKGCNQWSDGSKVRINKK